MMVALAVGSVVVVAFVVWLRTRADKCQGWRVTGRKCRATVTTLVEYVPANDLDSVEGYTKQIVPLIRRAPMCVECAAQGLKHWPFEFVIGFFAKPTKCLHPRANPPPHLGANTSSGCPDCGAVFRVGNGTWLGSAQDFGDDGMVREQ